MKDIFDYKMDNRSILCRNEDELKRALEIGSMFGFLPDWCKDIDDCIKNEVNIYNSLRRHGKVVLTLYANTLSITSTTMFCSPIEVVIDKHCLRSFKWFEKLLEEYSS